MSLVKHISSWHLRRAAEAVSDGGVIAYPTEAVYGLGCDPWNQRAVLDILKIKQRSISKGLIVIAADLSQLNSLVSIPNSSVEKKVTTSWPGPNTWILPASDACPYWLKGEHEGLAVRVTAHPLCRALCQLVGPIVSTSANVASKPAAKNAWQVEMRFSNQLDYILRGSSSGESKPSTIRDALTDQLYR